MELKPCRGEIWFADFEPVTGHEQGGKRPCVILSDDIFNHGPAEMAVVLPLTSRRREIAIRITVNPAESGLKTTSYIMPEMIRAISTQRLIKRVGALGAEEMAVAEARVRALLLL